MLSKQENRVMSAIYGFSSRKKAVLIDKKSLISATGERFDEEKLDKIVSDLHLDGYFDLVYTDRHGDKVYCVTLTEKGKGYPREAKIVRRNLVFRLFVSVGFAIFSFILGLILKAIFS